MISTANISTGGSSAPKVIQPGNQTCTIYSVTLDKVPYKEGAYNLTLHVVGPDMGDDFEGFYVDRNNPEMGRHKGQIGRVRMSEYPYADGTTKSGIEVKRDLDIVKALSNLCKELGCTSWLENQDNQHDTIESLIHQFNQDKPFADKEIYFCIAGKEYINKEGYTNFDLYLPKPAVRGQYAYQSAKGNTDKVIAFDSSKHIKASKPKTVQSFGSTSGSDFDVDKFNSVQTTSRVATDFEL